MKVRHILSLVILLALLTPLTTLGQEEPVEFVFAHPGPIRTMDAPVTWYGSTHWLTNLLYDCLIWRAARPLNYTLACAPVLS